ncbi:MAG TPA: NADP-dependent oxidoreductase [Solirubrobacteraceae bacterium]|jgi:NADPH2:quinone reductase
MQGLLVREPGGPQVMALSDLPDRAVGPGEVRVRVDAAGVNPVDAGNRADPAWAGIAPPYVVGYEFAGEATEVGDGVGHLAAGAAVWGLLPVRGTRWGAYAQEVVTDAGFIAPRPERLSLAEAAALPLAGATALQLLDRLDPSPGEWMLVHGAAGGVGHLLVQMARARGVRIAAAASPPRHALLQRLGVEVVIDRHRPSALAALREAVGRDLPLTADLVGGGCLTASLELMAEGGRAGSIVELAGDLDEALDRNLTLHGVLMRPGVDVLARLGALVEAGAIRPEIDEILPLEQAARAHERVESGSGQGKLVLSVPH